MPPDSLEAQQGDAIMQSIMQFIGTAQQQPQPFGLGGGVWKMQGFIMGMQHAIGQERHDIVRGGSIILGQYFPDWQEKRNDTPDTANSPPARGPASAEKKNALRLRLLKRESVVFS